MSNDKNINIEEIDMIEEQDSERDFGRRARIPYKNKVDLIDVDCFDLDKDLRIRSGLKLFGYKYVQDCAQNCKGGNLYPTDGDDIGFTLVFGNSGTKNYVAYKGPRCKPTVTDTLYVPAGVTLQLVDLCICDDLALFYENGSQVNSCDVFEPGYHKLIVKKNGVECFDIPCHSTFCISLLFRIELLDQCTDPCPENGEA